MPDRSAAELRMCHQHQADVPRQLSPAGSRSLMRLVNLGAIAGTMPFNCKHYDPQQKTCSIATELAGLPVFPVEAQCEYCTNGDARPQQLNRVTFSIALNAVGYGSDKCKVLTAKYGSIIEEQHEGPGAELERMISWFWSPKRKCGKCGDRARKMDKWGPEKCRKRKKLIVAWLKQSAKKHLLPFSETIAGCLVDRAIAAAEKRMLERNAKQSEQRERLATQYKPRPIPLTGPWVVAVTTAPRKAPTILTCVESLRACGWEPVVFAEPGSTQLDCYTVWNPQRLGVWRNWLHSAKWCLENTNAELILTVQDDSLFHPDSREFTESILWPANDVGFISLYTPKHYTVRKDGSVREPGVNRIVTKSLWGACALVWPRAVLADVVQHRIAQTWAGAPPRSRDPAVYQRRRENPHTIANSDTAIGKALNALGRSMWFVDPSPVQHIAKYSSISHGDNTGRRNAYRIADHKVAIRDQVQNQVKIKRVEETRMKIVTSFSPNRIERQQYCLSTWQKYGLPIVGVQMRGEAEALADHFPGVEWVETECGGDAMGRPQLPRVIELVKQAAESPILLVNSDISIKDTPAEFKQNWCCDRERTLVVGIRKDFKELGGAKYLNPYGIDAFRITPLMTTELQDLGFCIGMPAWDYWIPWHLWQLGYDIKVAKSTMLHLVHDQGYSGDGIQRGLDILYAKYRIPKRVMTVFIQEVTQRWGMKRRF